jgi:hypothetical protein
LQPLAWYRPRRHQRLFIGQGGSQSEPAFLYRHKARHSLLIDGLRGFRLAKESLYRSKALLLKRVINNLIQLFAGDREGQSSVRVPAAGLLKVIASFDEGIEADKRGHIPTAAPPTTTYNVLSPVVGPSCPAVRMCSPSIQSPGHNKAPVLQRGPSSRFGGKYAVSNNGSWQSQFRAVSAKSQNETLSLTLSG